VFNIFRIFFLPVLILLLQAYVLFSQNTATLKGIVFSELKEPVKQAAIGIEKNKAITFTDSSGYFTIKVPANKKITLYISHPSYENKQLNYLLKENDVLETKIELSIKTLQDIDVYGKKKDVFSGEDYFKIDPRTAPMLIPGVESIIKTAGLGVRSNNEMSSQYSVRGGNFDENLVYVNGIEIYRPFLVRAGQQEGLSFINPDMVEQVFFSAGGFEARYGDKLSSVLDIQYKRPTEKISGSASLGLMDGSLHLAGKTKNNRFTHLTGIRYRNNSYILNSLPTKGDYRPIFADAQTLLTYSLSDSWDVSLLAHYSDNIFRFVPQTRESEFGTINQALKLIVYYEGQEITRYKNYTTAISTNIKKKKYTLNFNTSFFRSIEQEYFDILGQYRLAELNRDLGSDEFGEILFIRGIGTYLNHARNKLDALIYNASHNGTYLLKKGSLLWGVKYQAEIINDRLSEWNFIDSAGFSIPQQPADQIILQDVIKSNVKLQSYRISEYLQYKRTKFIQQVKSYNDSIFNSQGSIDFHVGVRGHYWSLNNQFVIAPRAGIVFIPNWYKRSIDTIKRINTVLRLTGGYYYQPPFYRELRDFSGNLNKNLLAQRSIHFIAGGDIYFNLWERTFKFTSEIYYKHLNFVVPYEVDNVRLRYFANNDARGYAAGWDFKINGEFIKGIESWATLSFLQTREDIKNDSYTHYYNSDGERIIPGYTFNNVAVDSATFYPGYIPRPTDQLFSFNLFFQDEMPGLEQFKVHLNMQFASGLPFGPPDHLRYKDTLRTTWYRRVDIGFSYQFFSKRDKTKMHEYKIKDLWLSLEVFNLLGIFNTISYNWIEDAAGLSYAVPNYLTARRINLKMIVKF
jgi:hypothetical protein